MRGYLVGLSAGVLLLGTMRLAIAAEEAAGDERVLKQAGIATDGPGLIDFFRQRTADVSDAERIKALVRQLGADKFKAREKASRQLVTLGPRARPYLQAAKNDPDPEIARRAQECLERIGEGATGATISAAVRVLARQKPAEAAAVLLGYLPTAEDESVAETIRHALETLAVRDGKAEPALLAALDDKAPLKRGAAAAALARAHAPDVMPQVRKLL